MVDLRILEIADLGSLLIFILDLKSIIIIGWLLVLLCY